MTVFHPHLRFWTPPATFGFGSIGSCAETYFWCSQLVSAYYSVFMYKYIYTYNPYMFGGIPYVAVSLYR
jgi:hypothetical protein